MSGMAACLWRDDAASALLLLRSLTGVGEACGVRIRQVRPEFWSDATLGRFSDAIRLFYIGLWNIADDAGWFVWEPAQVGALLYPYKTPARREREISNWLVELDDRLIRYDCGCVQIPALPKHQRISGVQSTRVQDNHQANHKAAKPLPLSDKQSPLSEPDKQSPLSDSDFPFSNGKGRVGNGKEGYTRPLEPLTRARPRAVHGVVDPT